jgi:hypothetical protein
MRMKEWKKPTLEVLEVNKTMWGIDPCDIWPINQTPLCKNRGGGGGNLDS